MPNLSKLFLKLLVLVISLGLLLPLLTSNSYAADTCVATASKEIGKGDEWDLTVNFIGEPTNFVVHYEGTTVWTGEINPASNPFTFKQVAPDEDFTGVALYTPNKLSSLCAITKPGETNPDLPATFEKPQASITAEFKVLPSVVVTGLHPDWEYRIQLGGMWNGFLKLGSTDKFKADSQGRITVSQICDNGEGGRTDCGDTFEEGTYNLVVVQLDGKVVGSHSFGVTHPENTSPDPAGGNTSTDDTDESVMTGLGILSTNPNQLVETLLTIAIGIAGGIAFLLIIYGGFRLVFSQGDPKAVQEGREIITSAIIGLLIIVFSVFILNLIGVDILGLPIG